MGVGPVPMEEVVMERGRARVSQWGGAAPGGARGAMEVVEESARTPPLDPRGDESGLCRSQTLNSTYKFPR